MRQSLNASKRVWIDFPDVGFQSEEEVALLDPLAAIDVRWCATLAQNYAQQLQAAGLDGQRANAIQHAYWNALITLTRDASVAAIFTTAHEYSNRFRDEGLALDSVMDLHNNAIGRSIAINFTGATVNELQADLDAALQDGRLWIIDTRTMEVIRSNGERIFSIFSPRPE